MTHLFSDSVKMGCKKTCKACDVDFTALIKQDEAARPVCEDEGFCQRFFQYTPCDSPNMARNKEKYYDNCPVACGNPKCKIQTSPEANPDESAKSDGCVDSYKNCARLKQGKLGICSDPDSIDSMKAMCQKSCNFCGVKQGQSQKSEIQTRLTELVTCRDKSPKCKFAPKWRCRSKGRPDFAKKLQKLCPKTCQTC
jgi:hypothetical protein